MGTASRFFTGFAACIAVGLAALVALMSAAGELHTTRNAARAQLANGGIYGRVVWDDFFAYKMALFDARPTSAVSIGSSRAMPMRAGLFRNGDHLGLGGAVQSIDQLESTVAALVNAQRPPKLALVFVDFEWFILPPRRSQNDVARDLFDSPVYLLQSGFAKLRDLLRAASAVHLTADPVSGGPLFGGRARVWGDGFRCRRQYPEPQLRIRPAALSGTRHGSDTRVGSGRPRAGRRALHRQARMAAQPASSWPHGALWRGDLAAGGGRYRPDSRPGAGRATSCRCFGVTSPSAVFSDVACAVGRECRGARLAAARLHAYSTAASGLLGGPLPRKRRRLCLDARAHAGERRKVAHLARSPFRQGRRRSLRNADMRARSAILRMSGAAVRLAPCGTQNYDDRTSPAVAALREFECCQN